MTRSTTLTSARPSAWRPAARGCALALTLWLSACGGGGESTGDAVAGTNPAPAVPASKAEAARFLAQATFGPTEAEISRVMSMGYAAWIDEQFARPATSHRSHFEQLDAAAKASGSASAGQDGVTHAFWKASLSGEDQLRQRVAFALSQIFVISMVDGTVGNNDHVRGVAAYYDMLADKGLGSYRELLEGVATHPLMGIYLSHLRNQKADTRTGRVPDENFAREVMQLFSIGLHELNADGTPKSDATGLIETYSDADIAGLARVFTGWSWACPSWPDNGCFFSANVGGEFDPDRAFKPMQAYPQYHSTEAKTFLGKTVAAQGTANPTASLKEALDTLAAHPNVGPFIGRQLIQRLVTSNPSPAYVQAVGAAFNDNGSGVRGDLRAVVKAVLLHPEARASSDRSGKVREPILRLSTYMRAMGHTSDTGNFRLGRTDDPGTALAQSPMRSPSVFNFYRPGYVAPGTRSATAQLVVPEMQIVHETSAVGYVNFMRDAVQLGVGSSNVAPFNRRDLQADHAPFVALADRPSELLDLVAARLLPGGMPAALKTEIEGAVSSIAIPALNTAGTNQAAIDTAKRTRVNVALFLTVISPEYQVQR